MQALLSGHNIIAYLPFDESIGDALGKVQTSKSGTLQYYDAYFGKGVALNNGYVTLKDVKVGTGSFSVAFWLKGSPVLSVLPSNYDKGWMHVILTVDRENRKVRIYTDFAFDGCEADIAALKAYYE